MFPSRKVAEHENTVPQVLCHNVAEFLSSFSKSSIPRPSNISEAPLQRSDSFLKAGGAGSCGGGGRDMPVKEKEEGTKSPRAHVPSL